MIFCYPEIEKTFEIKEGIINSLIIENQNLFCRFLSDLSSCLDGNDGKSVLSENEKVLDISKSAELISMFVPFDLNRKALLGKLCSSIEKQAVSGEFYEKSMSVLSEIEKHLFELTFDMPCDVAFPKLSVSALIKAASPEIVCDSEKLSDKLLDYMELVRQLDKNKVFFLLNLRSYLSDEEMTLFAETAISHRFNVFLIENCERNPFNGERRLIIDKDLCEIY